jgi:hypothetical protein
MLLSTWMAALARAVLPLPPPEGDRQNRQGEPVLGFEDDRHPEQTARILDFNA